MKVLTKNQLQSYFKEACRIGICSIMYILSHILQPFMRVRAGRVVAWSYYFKQYSCNPRAICEKLVEKRLGYEIYWVVDNKQQIIGIKNGITPIFFFSWKFFFLINTAEFIITNCRTNPFDIYWTKRKNQKYIQTWHGSTPLKHVEKDAQNVLPKQYIKKALADSIISDLFISDSRFSTCLYKKSFWYDGEILECGLPRYDIFFNLQAHGEIRKKVKAFYNIPQSSNIILYAPTFRGNSVEMSPYIIDWGLVKKSIDKKFGKDTYILIRLHPNLIGRCKEMYKVVNKQYTIDATSYPDIQDLMISSELLITDYSSSMFEMFMLDKPCFLYAKDLAQYDRGLYFDINNLPYPISTNENELINTIENYNHQFYMSEVRLFNKNMIGSFDTGRASEIVVDWISAHSIEYERK